jgi:hypothetical protein
MKHPIIEINSNYGFDHNWTLNAYGRKFYLGQDVKFCSRVLGVEPRDIVSEIGSNDLREDSTRRKLARYILNQLDITSKNIKNLQPWSLCAE